MTGTELRERRKSLGYTQQELAEKMKVSVSSIARWEQLKSNEVPIGAILEFAFAYLVQEKNVLIRNQFQKTLGVAFPDDDSE